MHNMKVLREEKGLSQRDLARLLNITQQSVYKYENGISVPHLSLLREMSDFFDTTIDFLVDDHTYTPNHFQPTRLRLNKEEYYMLQNYRKLAESNQKMLRNITRKLTQEPRSRN